jgi:hypothetical protein
MSLDPWTTVVVKGKSKRAATSRLSPVVVACDFPSPSFRHVAPLSMDPATPARVLGLVASHHQRRKVILHLSLSFLCHTVAVGPLSELMKMQEILKGVESNVFAHFSPQNCMERGRVRRLPRKRRPFANERRLYTPRCAPPSTPRHPQRDPVPAPANPQCSSRRAAVQELYALTWGPGRRSSASTGCLGCAHHLPRPCGAAPRRCALLDRYHEGPC